MVLRYSDRVTFIKAGEEGYDPTTGGYTEGDEVKVTLPCNLTDAGLERVATVFGSVSKQIKVARLPRPFHGQFDSILANGRPMKVQKSIHHRRQSVFYLEGV